jgi:hypothetical protein
MSGNVCTVSWQPGPLSASSSVQITATFPGDVNNRGSSGRFQFNVNAATNSTSVVGTLPSVTSFLAGVVAGALVGILATASYLARKRGKTAAWTEARANVLAEIRHQTRG